MLACVLAYNPLLVHNPGFQLSVAASPIPGSPLEWVFMVVAIGNGCEPNAGVIHAVRDLPRARAIASRSAHKRN